LIITVGRSGLGERGGAVDIWTNYLGTSAGGQRGGRTRMCVRVDEQGVSLFLKKRSGGYVWDDVRRISFDDPGRTKASVAAIAMFGLAGLARRRAFTLITVTTSSEELYFEQDEPIGAWRAMGRRLVEEVPVARGRVYVDGQLLGDDAAVPAGPATADGPPAAPTSAGWYPDPLGMPRLRWYDGSSWTDHTSALPEPPT
jgi:hypothetical protein